MATDTAVDVKQVVSSARKYLLDLFPVHGSLDLEEVEPVPTDSGWKITFSYEREDPDPYGIRQILAAQQGGAKRVYKVVTVDAAGNPKSVKMR